MMGEIREVKRWVALMPAGPERDWWDQYLWYRENAIRLTWAVAASGLLYWLLVGVFNAPWSVACIPIALSMASLVLLLLIKIVYSITWNRKHSEG